MVFGCAQISPPLLSRKEITQRQGAEVHECELINPGYFYRVLEDPSRHARPPTPPLPPAGNAPLLEPGPTFKCGVECECVTAGRRGRCDFGEIQN